MASYPYNSYTENPATPLKWYQRMWLFKIPEPNEIASWFLYLGGLSMCVGNALFHEAYWPAFWYAGEYTIGFAVVYYLFGWWRL